MLTHLLKFQSTNITASNVFVQFVGVISIPVLSRLYTVEDFSLLAFFTSSVAVMTALLTLRIEAAIPLAEKVFDARRLLISAFILTSVASIIIILIRWISASLLEDGQALSTNIGTISALLPFGLLLSGFSSSILFFLIRERQYTTIAKLKSFQVLFCVVVQLGLGILSFGVLGLTAGLIVSFIIPSIYFLYCRILKNFDVWQPTLNLNSLRIIKNYRSFPLYSAPEKLISDLSLNLPLIIIAVFYEPTLAGLIFLALKVASFPLNTIGNSAGSIFTSRCTEFIRDGEAKKKVSEIINSLLFFGLLPLSFSLYFAEELFAFILGNNWSDAGFYLCLLFPGIVYQTIFSPISHIFYASGENKKFLFLSILSLIFRVFPLIFFIGGQGVFGLYLFFLGTFLSYCVFLIFTLRLCGSTYKEIFFINLKIMMVSSAAPLTTYLVFRI